MVVVVVVAMNIGHRCKHGGLGVNMAVVPAVATMALVMVAPL